MVLVCGWLRDAGGLMVDCGCGCINSRENWGCWIKCCMAIPNTRPKILFQTTSATNCSCSIYTHWTTWIPLPWLLRTHPAWTRCYSTRTGYTISRWSQRWRLLGFAHNDLQPSNIIVKDDKIVGIIDWEMAGFFGERAGEVHRTMRGPSRESVQHLGLSEEKILDVTFWNDLYEEEG